MPLEHCIDNVLAQQNEFDVRNQRYWFARVPPFVGFRRGERTTAGGDGTCFVGFPNGSSPMARILVDGEFIDLLPDTKANRPTNQTFLSADRRIRLQVTQVGTETTCVPAEEKSCGDYTYASITLTTPSRKSSVKAARYVGS